MSKYLTQSQEQRGISRQRLEGEREKETSGKEGERWGGRKDGGKVAEKQLNNREEKKQMVEEELETNG